MGRSLTIAIALLASLLGAACARAARPASLVPPVYLAEADARALLAHRADRITAGALAALSADAEAAARRGPQAPLPYSGCDLHQYVSRFSYEYAGAATRAAELANYVYLHALDPGFGNDRVADAAAAQARAVVLGWARDGFRKPDGSYRVHPADFCDANRPGSDGDVGLTVGIGLQLGRGVPSYAHALDLLARSGRLDPAEQRDGIAFVGRLGALIHEASDFRAHEQHLDCNRYSNHTSVAVAAMAAAARTTGNARWLAGLMHGDPAAAAIGWPVQVDHAIYAQAGPALRCYEKPKGDMLWQPPTAVPGEVADRYRQEPGQTLGYITFSLFNMVKPLVTAKLGGAPDTAFAEQRHRLGLALDYYAHYLQAIGPDPALVSPQLANWPGGEAYLGKGVSEGACRSEASSHFLYAYAAARLAGVRMPAGDALLSRIEADRRCPAPLSVLDPILIGAYAHLPAA